MRYDDPREDPNFDVYDYVDVADETLVCAYCGLEIGDDEEYEVSKAERRSPTYPGSPAYAYHVGGCPA